MARADILNPERPVGAYEDFLPAALAEAQGHREWTPADGRLPAAFISHGAPPVLDDAVWLRQFFDWAQTMPKPRGIVIVSAHWEDAPVAITASEAGVPLVYDFGGFAPEYYTLQYATPDATALAHQVAGSFAATTRLHQYTNRGLDHGAYVPLMAMYPAADIPVIQVSMPSLNPYELFGLGQRLRALRDEGILVIGSGFMTHWFGAFRTDPATWGTLPGFNADFEAWALETVARGDVDALADFRNKAPGNHEAHRTADHYVPLLLSLGAADKLGAGETTVDGVFFSNSKRSIQFS